MKERRRFVRIPEILPISYEVMPNSKSEAFLTRDISQVGIRFYIHHFAPKYSLLKIRLTLKKAYFSFDAVVRIIWIKEEPRSGRYEIGAEFMNLSEEAATKLINYIKTFIK